MEVDFKKHYDALDIDGSAEWPAVQLNYRRLVNLWHPDKPKHPSSDDETVQRRFIELTQAYNALREFYVKNNRLPLINQGFLNNEKTFSPETVVKADTRNWRNSGTQKRRAQDQNRQSTWKKLTFVAAGIFMLIGALCFIVILDKGAQTRAMANAQLELTTTEPSRFSADPDKITKAVSKGTFIQGDPLQKPLGNQSGTEDLTQ